MNMLNSIIRWKSTIFYTRKLCTIFTLYTHTRLRIYSCCTQKIKANNGFAYFFSTYLHFSIKNTAEPHIQRKKKNHNDFFLYIF